LALEQKKFFLEKQYEMIPPETYSYSDKELYLQLGAALIGEIKFKPPREHKEKGTPYRGVLKPAIILMTMQKVRVQTPVYSYLGGRRNPCLDLKSTNPHQHPLLRLILIWSTTILPPPTPITINSPHLTVSTPLSAAAPAPAYASPRYMKISQPGENF